MVENCPKVDWSVTKLRKWLELYGELHTTRINFVFPCFFRPTEKVEKKQENTKT